MPAKLMLNELIQGASAAWGAGRHIARSRDGSLFFAVQDGLNGKVLHRSTTGQWSTIPLTPQPTMRPTLQPDPSGLLVCAGYDHDAQTILAWLIDDYIYPDTTDPRVDALVAQNAQQAQQIQTLTTQNAQQAQQIADLQQTPPGSALTPDQAAALDWLIEYKAVLGKA